MYKLGEYDQFIGLYKNSMLSDACGMMVGWFNTIHQERLTLSAQQDNGSMTTAMRKDEVLHIPAGVPRFCFPIDMVDSMWQTLVACLKEYKKEYAIDKPLVSDGWKMHIAGAGEGYHNWHEEHAGSNPYRVLAWMFILQAPEEGGETEFLLQHKRYNPEVGNLLIWPAAFTHKHRGNPPLKGNKVYSTGWFEWSERIGENYEY